MKGQSAIEYLMTYGWMLLVVAVVGGVVFTLVQDQNVKSVNGFSGQDMIVENFGVSSANELNLQVLNARGNPVELKNVTVEGSEDIKYNDTYPGEPTTADILEIGSQESVQVTIPDFNNTNSGETYDVEIIYNRDGLTDLTSAGTITGTLSMLNTN